MTEAYLFILPSYRVKRAYLRQHYLDQVKGLRQQPILSRFNQHPWHLFVKTRCLFSHPSYSKCRKMSRKTILLF